MTILFQDEDGGKKKKGKKGKKEKKEKKGKDKKGKGKGKKGKGGGDEVRKQYWCIDLDIMFDIIHSSLCLRQATNK